MQTITNQYNNLQSPYTRNKKETLSFKAGKITLISDFDGTFMPFSHTDVCCLNAFAKDLKKRETFDQIYKKFDQFKEKAKTDFSFIITTGRSLVDFNYFLNKLYKQELKIPLPEKLITRDGQDIYHLKNNCFSTANVDENKRAMIKTLSNGWDGNKIKNDLQTILKNFKAEHNTTLAIIESPVNKHFNDYGEISLDKTLNSLPDKQRRYFASFRDDGDLGFQIGFHPSTNISRLSEQISKYFNDKNISASVKMRNYDQDVLFYDSAIGDLTVGKSITIKPTLKNSQSGQNKVLTKLFDTKLEVKKVLDNDSNDLIVLAGDGSNDADMLNIFNYVDLVGLKTPAPQEYKAFLMNPDNLNKIKKLPLISIIVGNNKGLDSVKQCGEILEHFGIKRVFTQQQEETLTSSLEKSINSFSEENNIFRKALNPELSIHLNAELKETLPDSIDQLYVKKQKLLKSLISLNNEQATAAQVELKKINKRIEEEEERLLKEL